MFVRSENNVMYFCVEKKNMNKFEHKIVFDSKIFYVIKKTVF